MSAPTQDRLCKFTGKPYSTTTPIYVRVKYNNIEVYNGEIATNIVETLPTTFEGSPVLPSELFDFMSQTFINGEVPLEVEVLSPPGARLFVTDILMPVGYNKTFDDGETWVISTNYYKSPNINTVATDGKESPTINGDSVAGLRTPEQVAKYTGPDGIIGEWDYAVDTGQIFNCLFFVDTSVIVQPLESIPPV
jgi:hypothetical protein